MHRAGWRGKCIAIGALLAACGRIGIQSLTFDAPRDKPATRNGGSAGSGASATTDIGSTGVGGAPGGAGGKVRTEAGSAGVAGAAGRAVRAEAGAAGVAGWFAAGSAGRSSGGSPSGGAAGASGEAGGTAPAPTPIVVDQPTNLTTAIGNPTGGDPYTDFCPPDEVLVGFSGFISEFGWLAQIQAHCAALTASSAAPLQCPSPEGR